MVIVALRAAQQTAPELDTTTLLVALATVIFAVALAQLCVLIIGSYVKNKARKNKGKNPNDLDGDGIRNENDLL